MDADIKARIEELRRELSGVEREKKAAEDEIKKCEQIKKQFENNKTSTTSTFNTFINNSSSLDISGAINRASESYRIMYDGCDTSYIESAGNELNLMKKFSSAFNRSLNNDILNFCNKIISREDRIKTEKERIVNSCIRRISQINVEIASLMNY